MDHLAGILAYDLRTTAPTAAGRVGWWREADTLVAAAIARSPDDPLLLTRRADLLLLVPTLDPAVAEALTASGRDRDLEALRALRRARRRTRPGSRASAASTSSWSPATRRGSPPNAVADRPDGSPRPSRSATRCCGPGSRRAAPISRSTTRRRLRPPAVILRGGLNLVRRVAADLEASPPRRDDARSLLEVYAKYVGRDDVVAPLRFRLRCREARAAPPDAALGVPPGRRNVVGAPGVRYPRSFDDRRRRHPAARPQDRLPRRGAPRRRPRAARRPRARGLHRLLPPRDRSVGAPEPGHRRARRQDAQGREALRHQQGGPRLGALDLHRPHRRRLPRVRRGDARPLRPRVAVGRRTACRPHGPGRLSRSPGRPRRRPRPLP